MNTDLHFADLGINGEAVGQLNKVIFDAITAPERLGNVFTIVKGINNGDKILNIHPIGLSGKAKGSCNPTWDTPNFVGEKDWKTHTFGVNDAICWADVPAALQRYIKNNDYADLIGNAYLDEIARPRLEVEAEKMYVRLGWFGKNNFDATKLITSANSVYFETASFDGIWESAATYVATHAAQLVNVAANEQTTYAAQKAAMLASGVATTIFDNLIMAASPALRQVSDGAIYCTLAMADALEFDIRHNNNGSELQWQSFANGVKLAKYNGVDLIAVPEFDAILSNYKEADRNPFRAIYTSKSNVLLGMHGDDDMSRVRVDYDAYHELNLLSAVDNFGAAIAQDDLFVLAI